jgi:hypothetical protein
MLAVQVLVPNPIELGVLLLEADLGQVGIGRSK